MARLQWATRARGAAVPLAWHVTLRADGTYAQWNADGNLDITGRYGVRGDVAVEGLDMVVKQDDCSVGRMDQWTARWTKVSGSVLRTAATLEAAKRR